MHHLRLRNVSGRRARPTVRVAPSDLLTTRPATFLFARVPSTGWTLLVRKLTTAAQP
jgi:hypothetical protein